MKLRLLLIALLFSILSVFTVSCDDSSDDNDAKECPTCEAYQECNDKTGVCELRDGFCETKNDCTGDDVCDANHKCNAGEDPLCNGRCLDQSGQKKGTCSLVGGLPVCECDADYLTSPNKLRCLEATDGCDKPETACGGNGECVADNDGTLACLCDENYLPDATDPLTCLVSPICSNDNHTGTCTKSCEACADDGTGNWECKVPAGERDCSGAFNDQCDPSLGWQSNPGCDSTMVCEGNDASDGYCTVMNCKLDSDCIETYGEKFTCTPLGVTGDGQQFGYCIKNDNSCFNADGTRKGGGVDGDRCSDACKDAACNTGLVCISGVCSKSCTGIDDDSCLQAAEGNRNCMNTSIFSDLTEYRCTLEAGLGESCFEGVAACSTGLVCLGDPDNWMNCYKKCNNATDCGGATCNILNGVDWGYCDAAPIADVGEECKDGVVGCMNDGWCLGSADEAHCYQSCSGTDDDSCAGGNPCNELGDGNGGIAGYYCEPVAPKTQEINEICDSFTMGCKEGGLCLGYQGQQNHCFAECSAADDDGDTECAGNQACIALGDTGSFYCNPDAPKENAAGERCNEFSGCLAGSTCLTLQSGDAYCFAECTTAADNCATDVGAGSVCSDFGDVGHFCSGAKTAVKFEECGLVKECAAGLVCLTHPDADAGYCYDECDTAANPSTCNADETCAAYNAEGDAFCMTECMADTECSIDKVCSTETFKCVVPEVAPVCTANEKRCANDNVETCNNDGSAWVVTDCTNNEVCVDDGSTVECVLPTATACATDGCDTLAATSCSDADTSAVCTLDNTNNCLYLVETDCVDPAPECFISTVNDTAACYATQVTVCSDGGLECAPNLNGKTSCDLATLTCVVPAAGPPAPKFAGALKTQLEEEGAEVELK